MQVPRALPYRSTAVCSSDVHKIQVVARDFQHPIRFSNFGLPMGLYMYNIFDTMGGMGRAMELSEIGNRIRSSAGGRGSPRRAWPKPPACPGRPERPGNGSRPGTRFSQDRRDPRDPRLELAPARARKGTGPSPILIKRMAQRYVWWQPPEVSVSDPQRVIAQVMDVGTLEDIQALAEAFGETR